MASPKITPDPVKYSRNPAGAGIAIRMTCQTKEFSATALRNWSRSTSCGKIATREGQSNPLRMEDSAAINSTCHTSTTSANTRTVSRPMSSMFPPDVVRRITRLSYRSEITPPNNVIAKLGRAAAAPSQPNMMGDSVIS